VKPRKEEKHGDGYPARVHEKGRFLWDGIADRLCPVEGWEAEGFWAGSDPSFPAYPAAFLSEWGYLS
jgi:hypothetical protein